MYARPTTRDKDFDTLLRGYYGLPRRPCPPGRHPAAAQAAGKTAAASLTLSADTGMEVLEPQPPEAPVEEYVVDRPEPPAPGSGTTGDGTPGTGATRNGAAPSPTGTTGGQGTLTAPAEPGPVAAMPPAVAPAPSAAEAPAAPANGSPAAPTPAGQSPAGPPVAPAPAYGASPATAAGQSPGPDDDQLAADMEAILSGRKIYDPQSGGLRDRGAAPAPPPRQAQRDAAKDMRDIFHEISASIEHSNSFDLGEVELRRRFDAFDKIDDRRRAQRTATPHAPLSPRAAVPAGTGTAEFVQDLDAIDRGAAAVRPTEPARSAYHQRGPWSSIPGWDAACGASSLALTVAPERSTAMFDTGEHVLAAGDLYPDRLRVGSGQGVPFSYGQIVAMGDFYESVDQMKNAPPAELSRLKALISRSTEYYRENRRDSSKDVSNDEWDQATGGRYLHLAEINYDHFSPTSLTGMTSPGHESDNRRRWEELHERALNEAAELIAAHPNSTPFLEGPLITNAFADHFLTDAFASGHLINKESVIAKFRSRFFSGGGLNDAATSFFDNVAERSYTGRVAERFRRLESSAPLCALGYCVNLHPNIRHWRMFAEVLKQAAEAEPVKIANLAVKVIHDKLNHDGVEVVNDAGDPAWTATGDGSMNPRTLAVMRKAVQQSVENLNDPSILVSKLNPTLLQQKVWRFTPHPTASGRAVINRDVETFTDPNNAELVTATANLITTQLDSLVKTLLDSGKMREDP